MKKKILLLLIAALFVSCEKEEPEENIYGFWKVEYAKILYFVEYDFIENKPIYDEKTTVMREYFGDYDGTPETIPQAGGFWGNEYMIEIDNYGFVDIYSVYFDEKKNVIVSQKPFLYYTINEEYFMISESPLKGTPNVLKEYYRYSFRGNRLIFEKVRSEYQLGSFIYTYCEYSRVK